MSRSNPTADSTNPVQRYYRWAGGAGEVEYYDRDAKETVQVKKPFIFLVLDQLSTVTGFSEREGGFWANEVRRTQDEPLVVRSKSGVMYEGLYKNMNLQGAKFATSVYIAVKNEAGELEIANIKFAGAALSGWIDFAKKAKLNQVAVAITGSTSDKKGSVKFERPIFAAVEVDQATDTAAVALDRELQEYLTNRPAAVAGRASDAAERGVAEDETEAQEAVIEAVDQQGDDGEIDLSSIKF